MSFKGDSQSRRDFLRRATLAGSAAVLAACAPSIATRVTPEVVPTATKEALPTNTPEVVKNYGPVETAPVKNTLAVTPPEYPGAMDASIDGMSLDDQEYEQAKAWLQLYKKGNYDGQEVKEWADQADFVKSMQEFAASHPDYVVKQVEAVDKSSVMTALVKSDGSAVVWGFDNNGILAFTEPNIYNPNNLYGEITLPENTRPEFAYNSEDKHWYLYAVGEDNKARAFFCATGATRDNLADQWIEYDDNGKLTKEYKDGKWVKIFDKPTIVFQMGSIATDSEWLRVTEGPKNPEEMNEIPVAGGLSAWPSDIPLMNNGLPAVGALAFDKNYEYFEERGGLLVGGILVGYQRFGRSFEGLDGSKWDFVNLTIDYPIINPKVSEDFPTQWVRRYATFPLANDENCSNDTLQSMMYPLSEVLNAIDENREINISSLKTKMQGPSRCKMWNERLHNIGQQPVWFGEVLHTKLNNSEDVTDLIMAMYEGRIPNEMLTGSATTNDDICVIIMEDKFIGV